MAERLMPLGVDLGQVLRMLEESIAGFRRASWEELDTDARIAFCRALLDEGEILTELAYTSVAPDALLQRALAAGVESRDRYEQLRRKGALESEEALGLPAARIVVANAEARLAKRKFSLDQK